MRQHARPYGMQTNSNLQAAGTGASAPTRAPRWPWVVLLVTAACEVPTTSTVTVSTILCAPSFSVPRRALARNGFDAGESWDAWEIDGGQLEDAVDSGFDMQTSVVHAFFGQRPYGQLATAPSGIAGVAVTLSTDGGAWALVDQGAGAYALPPEAGFVYQPGATYALTFASSGTTSVTEVGPAPAPERIPEFHPPASFVVLDAGTPFTFVRPAPADGTERPVAFVEVTPLLDLDGPITPTYSDMPKSPLGLLELVAAPGAWRSAAVTIPGDAFPKADHNYVVMFWATTRGWPRSLDLFAGSTVLAGAADVAIIKTNP